MSVLPISFTRILAAFVMVFALLYSAQSAMAQVTTSSRTSNGAEQTRPSGGRGLINPLGNRTPQAIIGGAVAWLGGLGGSLFFLYLLWGGVEWMTAGGSDQKVAAAQKKIVAAASGIAVILFAYMAVATIIGVVPRAL